MFGDCLGIYAKISEVRTRMSNSGTSILRMQAEKAACAMKVREIRVGIWQQLNS